MVLPTLYHSGINNSFVSLQPKIVEVNTIQTNAKHPGVSETSLQHSGSHSEDHTKKLSAKNKNYYERHKEFYLKESSDTRKILR